MNLSSSLPNKVWCQYCEKMVTATLAETKRHAETQKHQEAMKVFNQQNDSAQSAGLALLADALEPASHSAPGARSGPLQPAAASSSSALAASAPALKSLASGIKLLDEKAYLDAHSYFQARASAPADFLTPADYLCELSLVRTQGGDLLESLERLDAKIESTDVSKELAAYVRALLHVEAAVAGIAAGNRDAAMHKDFASRWAQAYLRGPPISAAWTKQMEQVLTQMAALQPPSKKLSESELIAAEWQRECDVRGARSVALTQMTKLTGLVKVKREMLNQYHQEQLRKSRHETAPQRRSCLLIGNPGSGKTTVARLYCQLMIELEVLPKSALTVECTGTSLAQGGVAELQKTIARMKAAGGGLLFVDEVYQLNPQQSPSGAAVLNILMQAMEDHKDKIIVAGAGYKDDIQKLLEFNPGLPSRFPIELKFEDYSDEELVDIAQGVLKKRNVGLLRPFTVESGPSGKYVQCAMRRLGRGRGVNGFGNARAVELTIDRIFKRQAQRLHEQRHDIPPPDKYVISRVDILGPRPTSAALDECPAWKQLQSMIGLRKVKQYIRDLVALLEQNYDRELQGKAPLDVSLNGCYIGNPGTGKTTVAKLFGEILKHLGMLSKGDLVSKVASDCIGAVIGASEQQTKAILKQGEGCVLIIDEAYALNPVAGVGGGGGGGASSYKESAINALVETVQNVPGEDRCVLLLGYTREMEQMMNDANPGLKRRFAHMIQFDDYSKEELNEIFVVALRKKSLKAGAGVNQEVARQLELKKRQPNFGNGGTVNEIIGKAILARTARIAAMPLLQQAAERDLNQIALADVTASAPASRSIDDIFSQIIGCQSVLAQVKALQKLIERGKQRGRADPFQDVPFNFLFLGPPGTGKTSVARLMGEVFYSLGALASSEVVECSASDFSTGYLGQSAIKTMEQLRKGLGKVLFIDEAYQLDPSRNKHSYSGEVLDEIVKALTMVEFKGKMVVILAGYERDILQLLSANAGLASRFTEQYRFEPFTPDECYGQLEKQLQAKDYVLTPDCRPQLLRVLSSLIQTPGWGNGRDVGTLASKIASAVAQDDSVDPMLEVIPVPWKCLEQVAAQMLKEKRLAALRVANSSASSSPSMPTAVAASAPSRAPVAQAAASSASSASASSAAASSSASPPDRAPIAPEPESQPKDGRDPGVSDAVWQALELAKADAARRQAEYDAAVEAANQARLEYEMALEEELEKKRRAEAEKDAARRALYEKKLREAQAELEQARLEEEKRRKEKEELERARRAEEAAQAKLRRMGVCVAGFQWIKLGGGYRCAGGSHFVSDAELR